MIINFTKKFILISKHALKFFVLRTENFQFSIKMAKPNRIPINSNDEQHFYLSMGTKFSNICLKFNLNK